MDIVLTDWRGIFTAEHPTLQEIPRAKNDYYTKLSLMALSQSPYIGIEGLPHATERAWKNIASMSYAPHFPYHAALLEHPTQARNILLASGDARTILHHSSLSSLIRHASQQEFIRLESHGILPIGIAIKHMHRSKLTRDDIHEMIFIQTANASFGIVPESRHIIRKLDDKGIQVKIVSSMPLRLSQAIARSVGMIASEDSCITGNDLTCMSDDELRGHVIQMNIFSELEFADEQRIARLFEEAGHRILRYEFPRA